MLMIIFLVKYHHAGNLLFLDIIIMVTASGAWGVIVKKLSDGNLILGGTIRENGPTGEQPWIIKNGSIR